MPVKGGKPLQVEVFVVPDISSIQDERLGNVKRDYLT